MDLRKLYDFIALADELHFYRASIRVKTDPATFSRRIRELERDVGTSLFSRTSRPTEITPAGRALLPWARDIVTKMEQALHAIKEAAAGAQEQLRVAFCDEIPHSKVAATLERYRKRAPRVGLDLHERPCAVLIQDLRVGVSDVGLTLGSVKDKDILAHPLWVEDALIAVPAGHPLSACSEVSLNELAGHSLILSHGQCECGLQSKIDGIVQSGGLAMQIKHTANLNLLLVMAKLGNGIGLISESQARKINDGEFTVRPFLEGKGLYQTYALRRKDDSTRQVERFLDLARLQR